jgi:hypothetical protein
MIEPALPIALTYAESVALREYLEKAIEDAKDAFLASFVSKDVAGVPVSGPDPRTVKSETALILARYLYRMGTDIADAAAFEAKIRLLEAELAEKKAVPVFSEDSQDTSFKVAALLR